MSASPASLGYAGRDAFAAVLLEHLRKVQRHYARLFEEAPAAEASRRALTFPPDKDDTETLDKLAAMGFRRPLEVSQAVRRWLAGEYRSLKSEFARTHLAELVPVLIDHLARSENPDQALVALDRFLAGLHGGARLLSLLRRNPDFVALLALALGTAPRLADILALHPHVMDALIEPSFFGALPDADKLAAELSATLAQASSYEDLLDRARQFGQEHMFLIGARILSGTVSAEQAGEAFARLADVHHPRGASRRGGEFRCRAWPPERSAKRGAGARQARRARDDGVVRSRSHHRLRFRRGAPAIRRTAAALWRAVFRAHDAAARQRARRRRPTTARSTMSTCGCGRPAAPARSRP